MKDEFHEAIIVYEDPTPGGPGMMFFGANHRNDAEQKKTPETFPLKATFDEALGYAEQGYCVVQHSRGIPDEYTQLKYDSLTETYKLITYPEPSSGNPPMEVGLRRELKEDEWTVYRNVPEVVYWGLRWT